MTLPEPFKALWLPLRAQFDLTLAERRFVLGVLILFSLGLVARWVYQQGARPAPYSPPQEQAAP